MELDKLVSALKSPTRRCIIQVLASEPDSSIGVYMKAKESNPDTPRREAIYKELQKLVEFGFLEKKYNKETKEIQYELLFNEITIHLPTMAFNIGLE